MKAHWQGEKGVWNRLGEHLYYSGVCLVIACLVALPLALWLGHKLVTGSKPVRYEDADLTRVLD